MTAVAPARFHGDFGWHVLQAEPGSALHGGRVPAHFTRPVHLMLYGRRLFELLRQPWDLVHCWEEPYIAAAAQVAARTPPGVPLVFATFQNIAKKYPPPFSWIERFAMHRADGLIAFGQTVLDVAIGRGFRVRARTRHSARRGRRAVCPDVAGPRRVRAELGWCDAAPVVGFLGRFVPRKASCGWPRRSMMSRVRGAPCSSGRDRSSTTFGHGRGVTAIGVHPDRRRRTKTSRAG